MIVRGLRGALLSESSHERCRPPTPKRTSRCALETARSIAGFERSGARRCVNTAERLPQTSLYGGMTMDQVNDPSKADPGRDDTASAAPSAPLDLDVSSETSTRTPQQQRIEAQRTQLLQALGVLRCLYEVLLHASATTQSSTQGQRSSRRISSTILLKRSTACICAEPRLPGRPPRKRRTGSSSGRLTSTL
jgi:hypothetical protein